MSENGAKLRLSIWRNFRPDKPLAHFAVQGDQMRFVGDDNDLQQEVFAWQVRESVLNGIADYALRAQLSECLIGPFNARLPPAERRMTRLAEFVKLAEKAIEDGEAVWSISEDLAFEDEDEPYTLNTLLAFVGHLRWLLSTFGDEPGISVSIR